MLIAQTILHHLRSLQRTASRSVLALVFVLVGMSSCIEPPLHLPAEEVIVDMPVVVTDMQVVWNIDVDWVAHWYYGWDKEDEEYFGSLEYPKPNNFEVRRYFLGDQKGAPHTDVDPFPLYNKTSFRRTYQFGYYDLLIWSMIDSPDGTQVVTIDESDLDNVTASTTVTRSIGLSRADNRATALYNQPEIFYSANPRDIHITHDKEDYDYYDEVEQVWVKHIDCTLEPLVYIYLVQIILKNNDGRVKGISGDCAISAMASGTNVNTAHTFDDPCMVYFNTRMKQGVNVNGEKCDIIGGKLTTYGLCDMDGYNTDTRAEYHGSRAELPNYLYFDLNMSGGSVQTLRREVTKQCQSQCHGGVITVEIDCRELEDPHESGGQGSLFNPTVEDYDELVYDIPM